MRGRSRNNTDGEESLSAAAAADATASPLMTTVLLSGQFRKNQSFSG